MSAEVEAESEKSEPPRMPNRLTVVESVSHQIHGEQPTAVESRFARHLESEEQPYNRRLRATEDWELLDLGWVVGDVGMLHITNLAGKGALVNPTEEEKTDQVVEITHQFELPEKGRVEPDWIILPGETMRAHPAEGSLLYVRSRRGTIRFSVFVVPS